MSTYTDEDKAVYVIKVYLNKLHDKKWTKEYVLNHYGIAVQTLIENSNKISGVKMPGVKTMTEGNQSISFNDNVEPWSITDDVKCLLPSPFIRVY